MRETSVAKKANAVKEIRAITDSLTVDSQTAELIIKTGIFRSAC